MFSWMNGEAKARFLFTIILVGFILAIGFTCYKALKPLANEQKKQFEQIKIIMEEEGL